MVEPPDVLDRARRDAGLSRDELWLRYFALGGMRTAFELEAYLCGALVDTPHDRDLIALALNERFAEWERHRPVRYSDEDDPE